MRVTVTVTLIIPVTAAVVSIHIASSISKIHICSNRAISLLQNFIGNLHTPLPVPRFENWNPKLALRCPEVVVRIATQQPAPGVQSAATAVYVGTSDTLGGIPRI